MILFYVFPDVVDSRFTGQVDIFLESFTTMRNTGQALMGRWDVVALLIFSDVCFLQSIFLSLVNPQEKDGNEDGSARQSEEDEHGGGVGGIRLIGFSYADGDDRPSEVLDEEYHGIRRSKTFQGYHLGYSRP